MLRTLPILILGSALGVLGTLVWLRVVPSPWSQRAESDADVASAPTPQRSIIALGTLEPRDSIIVLSGALVGHHIKKVNVEEGQAVKPGDVLIELDAAAVETELQVARALQSEAEEKQQAEIELAKERVKTAQLGVQQASEGRQLELDAQRSRIAVVILKMVQAEKDLENLQALRALPEALASRQQVEHQQVLLEGARAEHEASRIASKRLEQSLNFQQQTAAAELKASELALSIAEKGTGLESLRKRTALAELKLTQTQITAPSAGVVLNVMAHPGEVVSQQPLLQLADVNHIVCVAEIEVGDVARLNTGQDAIVSSRAFNDATLPGKVDRIGNVVTRSTLRTVDPRQSVDRNVAKAIVLIDSNRAAQLIHANSSDRRTALIGLQVEVEFPLAEQPK